jgi:hypothetical protein
VRSEKEREMLRKMHEKMRKDRQRKTNAQGVNETQIMAT